MTAWLADADLNWQPAYPFDNIEVRNEVRNSLLDEQKGLCVYCGRRLNTAYPGKSYHVEHFRPQSEYTELSVNYSNLFLSCGQLDVSGALAQTCGTHKGNWFDELLHVYPSYPECTDRFRFLLDGTIRPVTDSDGAAQTMLDRLALNHPELVKDRSDVLALIDDGKLDDSDFWDAGAEMAESYAHVVFKHIGKTIP